MLTTLIVIFILISLVLCILGITSAFIAVAMASDIMKRDIMKQIKKEKNNVK